MALSSWLRREAPRPVTGPARPEEAASLAAVHAEAFARPWSEDEILRLLGERGVLADELCLGPDLVGFVLSRRVLDEAEILTVALARAARGQGYARPLLLRHLGSLVRAGARVVHLEVEEGNAPALALYTRLGFRQVGRREGYYAKPDGSRVTALTFSLRL